MKVAITDLSIQGGKPTFNEPLHVGRPNIGDREQLFERINDMLDRKWLTNAGVYVQEFENRIAELLNVKHCIVMCNGTVALEIAIRAAGLTGEVIVPSMTFVATAHALQWQEIRPVFCDIDPRTTTIDPSRIEDLITPHTTGIIGVHLWSRPCDIDALTHIAKRHNLKLMFDAAHAFGCSYQGKMIGGFGDAEVLSFHATKFLNSFEGGAVVTNDDDLAEKIRLMKNFGFAGQDTVVYIGINGKMSEASAAMGLTSLDSMDHFIETNRNNYQIYHRELEGIPGVHLLAYDMNERSNYQYVVIEIDERITNVSRDNLVKILHAENVIARRYFYPGVHRMEPYRSFQPHARLLLPNTEKLAERVIVLPTGTSVGESEIKKICGIIKLVIKSGEEISKLLTA